ncbi:hypothetical protein FGO68_gene11821 [Halteria grandinella]|uniref:Uncharacterized protein n=1 Tax=Halteria grandinella TaxID=5974 RepID=A0A8J8P369_HALGN|nr:hypothetical protein FGO68_gene11821 [Halteria grandinella]
MKQKTSTVLREHTEPFQQQDIPMSDLLSQIDTQETNQYLTQERLLQAYGNTKSLAGIKSQNRLHNQDAVTVISNGSKSTANLRKSFIRDPLPYLQTNNTQQFVRENEMKTSSIGRSSDRQVIKPEYYSVKQIIEQSRNDVLKGYNFNPKSSLEATSEYTMDAQLPSFRGSPEAKTSLAKLRGIELPRNISKSSLQMMPKQSKNAATERSNFTSKHSVPTLGSSQNQMPVALMSSRNHLLPSLPTKLSANEDLIRQFKDLNIQLSQDQIDNLRREQSELIGRKLRLMQGVDKYPEGGGGRVVSMGNTERMQVIKEEKVTKGQLNDKMYGKIEESKQSTEVISNDPYSYHDGDLDAQITSLRQKILQNHQKPQEDSLSHRIAQLALDPTIHRQLSQATATFRGMVKSQVYLQMFQERYHQRVSANKYVELFNKKQGKDLVRIMRECANWKRVKDNSE